MRAIRHNVLAVAAAAMVLAVQVAQAADQPSVAKKAATETQDPLSAEAKRTIVVSLTDRKLALIEEGQVKKVYSVAVGKPSTPSPVGTYTIERRVVNPVYSHNGRVVPAGPGNPVGTRWMGLSIKGYGIHGTNEPKSIGKAASHGCIRMAKSDIEELFSLVSVGDTVELVGQRNDETAKLFGAPGPVMSQTSNPTQSAKLAPAPASSSAAGDTVSSATTTAIAGTM
jgi:lipoprotein-anchoring transpeptidase ErfK/SrfK